MKRGATSLKVLMHNSSRPRAIPKSASQRRFDFNPTMPNKIALNEAATPHTAQLIPIKATILDSKAITPAQVRSRDF